MATGMQINSIAIPSPMDERGSYKFSPPAVVARNGAGLAVTAGTRSLSWQWPYMARTDFVWWTTTLLAGAASAEFTQCKLINDQQTLTTYTHCIVHRPDYERIENGLYYNVTLTIEAIT